MVLGLSELPVIKKPFHVPSLEEIANVLNGGLKKHFAEIHVSVVECPDLTKPPFGLVSQGLGGNPRLIEVGAANYLLPLVNREKTYELKDIAKISEINPAFIIGAGAGPFKFQKTNCEGIININIDNGVANQQSRIGKINPVDKSRIEEILPQNVTDFALLANLFATEGKPGKVLKVHAAKRIGSLDYIASIRTILTEFYEQKKVVVGMGGTFLMKEGKAKLHIMPDFSASPINNWDELNQWLQFFNMSAPLIGVGTFTTSEYDIDLRVQHFHMFSNHGDAGHYHIDTTPEEVEYLGYFNTGDFIYRVDKPENSIPFGKD